MGVESKIIGPGGESIEAIRDRISTLYAEYRRTKDVGVAAGIWREINAEVFKLPKDEADKVIRSFVPRR